MKGKKREESISLKLTHIANETTAETTAKSKKKNQSTITKIPDSQRYKI